jgi:mRNA-degrading endonuclease RelE of RelBE toxin-antitoxin system
MASMSIEPPEIQIELTVRFRRNLKSLVKRYRSIQNDLQTLIEQLQQGELPGDRIPDVKFDVFKVRLKNSDIQKGKSAGYRVIYYVKTLERVVLAAMYSKSDQEDIAADEIESILTDFEKNISE